jgi:hypothetical protein
LSYGAARLLYNFMHSGESQPKFRRNISQKTACHLLQAGFLLGMFFDLADGDDTFFGNIS